MKIAQGQRLWRNVHLGLGAGLALLLIPLGLSGSLLLLHEVCDAWLHPARYAVGETIAETSRPSDYMTAAQRVLGPSFQPLVLRFPDAPGMPATVSARENEPGQRPRLFRVYLGPGARVLDVADARGSLVGILHRFHENLTVPEYGGRDVVGWAGVAMLTLSLTGLYLWWPRGAWRGAFRWQRGPNVFSNLHHLCGIGLCIPLAVLSLTGIYLAFPQQTRTALSSVAAMSPSPRGGLAAPVLRQTRLSVDEAVAAAQAAIGEASVAAVFRANAQTRAWRIQLRRKHDELVTVIVDDHSGAIGTVVHDLAGDRIAAWIRWIHEGERGGAAWRAVVFLSGVAPLILAATGIVLWWRRRRRRAIYRSPMVEASQLGAAE